MEEKLKKLAALIEEQQVERLKKEGLTCEANIYHSKVKIIPGRKYTKVNVGDSGKYMVDQEGNIWGIKAYGQVHKGHYYGTLDTIWTYYWGGYAAVKK